MWLFQKSISKQSSRKQIDFEGINDELLKINRNEYRAILKVSSINVELRSDKEKDAILNLYQSFLNSLQHPLQIIVRIRAIDINKYLEGLSSKHRSKDKTSYNKFVKKLVKTNRVLTRTFYLVIPITSTDNYLLVTEKANLRCELVKKSLSNIGIHSQRLSNSEILDLFYSLYNPEKSKTQPVSDLVFDALIKANY
jgi:hypothetical protein